MLNKADLIDKLFKSQCSESELHQLMKMMNDTDDGEKHTAVFERLWHELDQTSAVDQVSSIHIYNRTISKIKNEQSGISSSINEGNLNQPVRSEKLKRTSLRIFSVAASFLILIGAVSWAWMNIDPLDDKIKIATSDIARTIELPDQSIVRLTPYSQLSYTKNWSATMIREVILEGEAFFKVKKYPSTGQKFQVLTSDLIAEVLGTSFSVNTKNNETEVFLEEGKVKLDLKEHKVDMLMQVGDVITYSLQTKERSKEHVTADKSIIWKKGMTTMKNIPLSEILQNIEDIYKVKFHIEDEEAMNRVFTIGIPIDNFETTLSVLKEVMKLNVIQNGDQYVIQ